MKIFQKNKTKLKQQLLIEQNHEHFYMKGLLRDTNKVSELWIFSRNKAVSLQIASMEPSHQFEFRVPLTTLLHKVLDKHETTYDWYLKVTAPFEELSEVKQLDPSITIIEKDDRKFAEHFIRLGRFSDTQIQINSFYKEKDDTLLNYVTTKGNLSLVINEEPHTPIRIQVDKFKRRQSKLVLEGKIFTRNAVVQGSEFILQGRDSGEEISSSTTEFQLRTERVRRKFGLNQYIYRAEIDLELANSGKMLAEDIYDLYFKLAIHDQHEPKYVRIGRPAFRARFFLKDLFIKNEQEAAVIRPYYTFKAKNLSLEVTRFPVENFYYLKKMMRWSWFIRLANNKKNVWLVGERVYKAQDTGLAFFRHIRTNHPEQNAYYVIEKDSPERKNVEKYGNVLEFKSKEHIFHSIIAKKVISSHHPDYLYPIRTNAFKAKVKADKVFLQHGVMGTKNMVANYGKNAPDFDVDFFIVSSDFEKDMIVNDFDYDAKDVFVTGLSRFDTLFANDVEVKRQILVIPTWRDWLVSYDAFIESEYYARYQDLINSDTFHMLAEKYHFHILFCLHPNMQKFTEYFENEHVQVISQGEVDVQQLIKESALMITDYSSVGFDFSFLHKPVIYYQFDRDRFIGKNPSHLNLDEDLPGNIAYERDKILKLIEEYASNDFAMLEHYKHRANKFIKYRDQNSSERIYQVVINNKAAHPLFQSNRLSILSTGAFNKYRRSKIYFPVMKLFYRFGKVMIPVDDKLVLFESGIGKQYSDSPRMIYEELLKRNLDFKYVWVNNGSQRFNSDHTIRIKRLSPAYYYYLLRARYWVNNQNFPTYITKRSKTTYLQTWHGTPLKKMLYDMESVHGRSDDYVERVGNAVKNWDYLISPSQYATKAFRSAFRYEGEVLEVGYPRNDIFYKEERAEVAELTRIRLGLPKDKKVVLYAPTFRDYETSKKNKFKLDLHLDLHKLKEELGDEYVIVLRMHTLISNKITINEDLEDFVINASTYGDIQELYLITDILITDYSSVMFDFANSGKPMLFFTYDFELYRDNIRGFYLDFEAEAPGPLVYHNDEIIDSIQNIEKVNREYAEKYQAFREKFCSLDDGEATERVVDKVFEK